MNKLRITCPCRKEYDACEILIANGMWTTLFFKKELDKKYYLAAYGDDEAKVEINYCPFCGRRLFDN